MKKKLALLLAAVMTLPLLPSLGVFAATQNRISKILSIPSASLLFESYVLPMTLQISQGDHEDIDYYVDGSDLVLTLSNGDVRAGDAFNVRLTNAKWFFRSTQGTPSAELTDLNAANGGNIISGFWKPNGPMEKWAAVNYPSELVPADPAGFAYATYDTNKGIWGTELENGIGGTYYRYGDTAPGFSESLVAEIPYKLTVSGADDSTATIEVLTTRDGSISTYAPAGFWQIRIPLVSRITGDEMATARITSYVSSISSGTYLFVQPRVSATKTYATDPVTAKDDFDPGTIVIQETRIRSIPDGCSAFSISAPAGFMFNNPANIKVALEKGLSWEYGAAGFGREGIDYTVDYRRQGSEEDYSVLEVVIHNVNASTNVAGAIYLTDVTFTAEDNAPFGDIMFQIKNIKISDAHMASGTTSDKPIAEESFLAGTRKDWSVKLSTEGAIPTLFNGRYDDERPECAADYAHQTAMLVFQEDIPFSWWGIRNTVFTLPDGVKFRKIEFETIENLEEASFDALIGKDNGRYVNDGQKHDKVTIDGNTMTWTGLNIGTKRAKIKFNTWISIESGFEGDVTMTVNGVFGNSIPVEPVVIAKVISPVRLTTEVTDIKAGQGYQKAADIIITENLIGVFKDEKEVLVSIGDTASPCALFADDVHVEVTKGNWKIRDVKVNEAGTISFMLDQPPFASPLFSEITISNVSVNADGAAGSSDVPYKVVVWGEAIAPNYTQYNYNPDARDKFDTPGIMADYIRVTPSDPDEEETVPVTGLQITGASTTLGRGKTMMLTPVVSPSIASNQDVLWKSSNEKVATVEDGVVKAVATGSVTITATTVDGEFTRKIAVKIM